MTDRFDLDFKAKPDTTSVEAFSEVEIQKLLSTLPVTARYYGEALRKKTVEWEELKHEIKVEKAKKKLESVKLKEQKQLLSEGDRKAWVDMQPSVIKLEVQEIKLHGEVVSAEITVKYVEDLFTAVRKAANLIELDNRNMSRVQ